MGGTIDAMLIAAISDLHNEFPEPVSADVIIVAGDMTVHGSLSEIAKFSIWLQQCKAKTKIVVAGNHDKMFEFSPDITRCMMAQAGAVVLQDRDIILENGVKVFGQPWVIGCSSFGKRRGQEMHEIRQRIHKDTDILVTHSPPKGILDAVDGRSVGDLELAYRVEVVRPKYHIFGHIHPSHGWAKVGETTYMNVSHCEDNNYPVHGWTLFDYETGLVKP